MLDGLSAATEDELYEHHAMKLGDVLAFGARVNELVA